MADVLSRWREGLKRTGRKAFAQVATVLGATEISPQTWEELEALLIQADIGSPTASVIIGRLREAVLERGVRRSEELLQLLREELASRLTEPPPVRWLAGPQVLLIVGVNGSGKTTTIAKLTRRFQGDGRTILLGAADTFRAAASEQLALWGDRLGVKVITGAPGSDPGAVAFNTVKAGVAQGADLIIIDTAGRLHSQANMMEELKKVHRVVGKALPGAPHAVWLVLDATTGQNTIAQARAFTEAVHVTGVVLAKLDSSARGGMAFAVQKELGLPILFAGLGEDIDDLEEFNPSAFVDGILAPEQ